MLNKEKIKTFIEEHKTEIADFAGLACVAIIGFGLGYSSGAKDMFNTIAKAAEGMAKHD